MQEPNWIINFEIIIGGYLLMNELYEYLNIYIIVNVCNNMK